MPIGICLISYILLCPALCRLSYQENKVYSYVFYTFCPVSQLFNQWFAVSSVWRTTPSCVDDSTVGFLQHVAAPVLVYYSCTGCLQFSAFMLLIELHWGDKTNILKIIMHHQKHSRMLMIQQVHTSKQPAFVLWRVNSETHWLASSSFHTQR